MLTRVSGLVLSALAAILCPLGVLGARAVGADHPIEARQAWQREIYAFATDQLQHPAWGWRHSERDYLLALSIAQREHLLIDPDVLFAAAFLHDMGAIPPFAVEGVDHAERSAELAPPLLIKAGFPPAKVPAVRRAILGHMFNKDPGSDPEAIALHDADTLDFLGASGIARRLAVTGSAADFDDGLARIERYSKELPAELKTGTGRRLAARRVHVMQRFIATLNGELPSGSMP